MRLLSISNDNSNNLTHLHICHGTCHNGSSGQVVGLLHQEDVLTIEGNNILPNEGNDSLQA